MLWFGISIVEDDVPVSQEIHGPFEDTDSLTEAMDERVAEAEVEGQLAVPLSFELCTDDVPEILQSEFTGR